MKYCSHFSISSKLCAFFAITVFGGSMTLPNAAFASGGKTTTTTTTSGGGGGGGGTSSGGGGGSTSTTSEPISQAGKKGGSSSTTTTTITTTTPTTPPTTPIVSGSLTFAGVPSANGVVPQASGSWHVDPYYPTLSFLTVDLSCSNLDESDGSICLVYVTTNSIYGGASGSFYVAAGTGSATINAYVSLGSVVTGVTVTDLYGQTILTGN